MSAWRVPVIDKAGNVITALDVKQVDETGVLFIGSGMERRTFRYNGGMLQQAAFVEAEAKTLVFGFNHDGYCKESIRCEERPEDKAEDDRIMAMSAEEARAEDTAERHMMTVQLPPGHRVLVEVMDSDGKFMVSYDYRGDRKLTVRADLPGSKVGDAGIIYCEEFGPDGDEKSLAEAP